MNDLTKLSVGTFRCDICGLDKPHAHAEEEVEIERFIRPAFEQTIVPGGAFARYGLGATIPYLDGMMESLWQHFISGWYASKRHAKSIEAAENPPAPLCPFHDYPLSANGMNHIVGDGSESVKPCSNVPAQAECAARAVLREHLRIIQTSEQWWMDCPDKGGFNVDTINEALAQPCHSSTPPSGMTREEAEKLADEVLADKLDDFPDRWSTIRNMIADALIKAAGGGK